MSLLEDFNDIARPDERLAPFTWMKIGGPAQFFFEPRNPDELTSLIGSCHAGQVPVRVLGGGSNVLIRDAGVEGAVIRISGAGFANVETNGMTIRAGAGVPLSQLISHSVRAGLAGLEALAGIPGTVGGAIHGNAGGHSGDVGQSVKSVEVLTVKGDRFTRTEDELSFAYRESSVDELAILEAVFQLQEGDPGEITRRMRKLWIMRKATQPLTFQSAGCIFRNPRGMSAGALIEQAGLKGTRIGNAEISDRHANFVIAHDGAKSDDVLQLIDLARSKVSEQFGVDLELEIEIW